MDKIGAYIIPVMIAGIVIFGLVKGVGLFDSFLSGAKEGIKTSFSILPSLIGLLAAVEMFKASGALDMLAYALKPAAELLGLPCEVMPLALMRPVSGSGGIVLLENLFQNYGPDSFVGRVGSVLAGATETTFYTIAVYYGAVAIRDTRHTIPSALAADFVGIVCSSIAVRLFL